MTPNSPVVEELAVTTSDQLERLEAPNSADYERVKRAWWLLSSGVSMLLLGLGCASTNLVPLGDGGATFQLEDDEQRLWNRAREEQERLDRSGLLYADPELEAYVNEVAQRLLPAAARWQGLSLKVQVIQNPLLNAFVLPNGMMYVHTGLLARMDNEAQLAALLGHEITHVTHRHTIKQFRSIQNKAAFAATLHVTLAGIPFGNVAAMLGTIGTIASVYGYSRDHEREADLEGFKRMERTGYDLNEAPKLFAHLQRDLDPDQEKKEPFFFGTHPRLQERIESYTELLRRRDPRQDSEAWRRRQDEVFRQRTHRLLLDNAVMDLRAGRFNTAKAAIEKFLQQDPHHPRGLYHLGEVLRQQGKPEHMTRAVQAYEAALQHDPSFPDPLKGLGLLYYKQQQREQALQCFEGYLALAPETVDREYIEGYLRSLKTGGSR